MAIWTSRYSNKKMKEDKWYAVGISLGTPKFPLGYEIREKCYSLAPKGYMLKMPYEPYREAYFKKLDDIGRENIFRMVQRMEASARAEGKELVLLCYEDVRKEGEWCHRTLFAEWWMNYTGEVIKELDDPTPVKGMKPKAEKPEAKEPSKLPEPEMQQLDLFSAGLL